MTFLQVLMTGLTIFASHTLEMISERWQVIVVEGVGYARAVLGAPVTEGPVPEIYCVCSWRLKGFKSLVCMTPFESASKDLNYPFLNVKAHLPMILHTTAPSLAQYFLFLISS